MENIILIFNNILFIKILKSVVIVFISIIIYKILTYFLVKGEERDTFNLFTSKKSKTYLNLIKSIIRYIFLIVTCLVLLQINGIDVSSLLAGVGILGVVLGLAIQDWLKDIIRGSSILSDNYFSVGDIVKYQDFEGKVLIIGLKTTKIQDLKTGNIISIANRNIETIQLVSKLIYINVPMPYEIPTKKAERVIRFIVEDIEKNDNVEECNYRGVNDLADSSINYLLEIKANPLYKLQVRRDALRSILIQLNNNNIEVPYKQIDIHQK